jgi:hypothetical protein
MVLKLAMRIRAAPCLVQEHFPGCTFSEHSLIIHTILPIPLALNVPFPILNSGQMVYQYKIPVEESASLCSGICGDVVFPPPPAGVLPTREYNTEDRKDKRAHAINPIVPFAFNLHEFQGYQYGKFPLPNIIFIVRHESTIPNVSRLYHQEENTRKDLLKGQQRRRRVIVILLE